MTENDLRKLSAVDPDSFGGLAAFYREKIRMLEEERTQWMGQFGKLQAEQSARHHLALENVNLKNRIADLEMTLAESKALAVSQEKEKSELQAKINQLEGLLRRNGHSLAEVVPLAQTKESKKLLKSGVPQPGITVKTTVKEFKMVRPAVGSPSIAKPDALPPSRPQSSHPTPLEPLSAIQKENRVLTNRIIKAEKDALENLKLIFQKEHLHTQKEIELQEKLGEAHSKIEYYVDKISLLTKTLEEKRHFQLKSAAVKADQEREAIERRLQDKSDQLKQAQRRLKDFEQAITLQL